MTAPAGLAGAFQYSVVPAVVVDNGDPDQLGRVKVRYPWMDAGQSTDWVQISAPAAGSGRGIFFVPEPQDQVLVAFAFGRIDRAYVIGALWSSNDKPPDTATTKRMLKTKSGHVVVLDDSDGAEQILIVDKSGSNKILLDAANSVVTIESGGDLKIKATGTVALEATGDLSLKGANVTIKADSKLAVSGQQVTVDGPTGVNINNGALQVT
jgi:phage baseplate assembly protein V